MSGSTWLKEVRVDAIGDDFVQLSGVWLQGMRVAAHVAKARRVWVFAASDREQVPLLIDSVSCEAKEHVIGISPGMHADWPESEREALLTMLGNVPDGVVTGLLLAVPAPDCENCPGTCGGCHAIK